MSFYFEAFRILFLTSSVQAVVPSPVRRLNVFSAVYKRLVICFARPFQLLPSAYTDIPLTLS